jgi:hypothetical protein
MNHDPLHSLDQAATEVGRVHVAAARAAEQIAAELGASTDADSSGPLLAGLSSAVIERIEAIRGDCEQLAGLIDRATSLGGERQKPEPVPEQPAPEQAAAVPASAARVIRSAGGAQVVAIGGAPLVAPAEPQPRARRLWRRDAQHDGAGEERRQVNSEGVRLVVKQMAIAGASRGEIERRLRIQFGVNDADGALDEIFGQRGRPVEETA